MKKILFILPTLSAGGAENYALRFIKHNLSDFDFQVLTVNLERGDLYDEFEALGIPILYRSMGYFSLKDFWGMFKLFRAEKYDTVCNFNGSFSGISLTLAKYAGIKNRIVFYRRSTNAFGSNKFKMLYNNYVNGLVKKNATTILSNSETAFKNFHADLYKIDPRYKIIKNGVSNVDFNINLSKKEAREVLNLENNTYLIGHIGRYDFAKNHETIFKVIATLKERHKNFSFVFCGKGTDSHSFLNRLRDYDIEDVVIALGLRNDLPLVYKAFDVFYFPSITEGQPNALIEAMISGLPVITSNIEPILDALPSYAESLALPANDVLQASEKLGLFYNKDMNWLEYTHQEWAIKNFDLVSNFNEFKNLL